MQKNLFGWAIHINLSVENIDVLAQSFFLFLLDIFM